MDQPRDLLYEAQQIARGAWDQAPEPAHLEAVFELAQFYLAELRRVILQRGSYVDGIRSAQEVVRRCRPYGAQLDTWSEVERWLTQEIERWREKARERQVTELAL